MARLDADVIVVGAGPVGLMLAGELRLADVRVVVLERQPAIAEASRAYGLNGQVLEVLRHRDLLDRLRAAGYAPAPARAIPFGGLLLDLGGLADSPLQSLGIPQPQLEQSLERHARLLGAEIRRAQEVVAVGQNDATVAAEVSAPKRRYRVQARYLVGCDGARSVVRTTAGISFPGTTYPEVNRLGQVTVAESMIRNDTGELTIPGLGVIRPGFTRTERGVFASGWSRSAGLLLQTTEHEPAENDDTPMTVTELRDSIRRVLGADLPLHSASRLSRYTFQARLAEHYRSGRVLLAGDAAHQFPATGIGLNVGLLDAVNLGWKLAADIHGYAPAELLDTYEAERHYAAERAMLHSQAQAALRRGLDPAADALRAVIAELLADARPLRRVAAMVAGTDIRYPMPNPNCHDLAGAFAPNLALRTDAGVVTIAELMRPARPVFVALADRPELLDVADASGQRINVHNGHIDDRPADALLIRPDGYIAWAATVDQPSDTAAAQLRQALSYWIEP